MSNKLFTLITCLILAACNLPNLQPATSAPQTWFDMPLPDTVVFLPNSCQVIAHGASPNGIALFELSINGTVAASLPNSDTGQNLATLEYNCSLTKPGKNLLELRVQDNAGEWSDSTQTIVFLAGNDNNSTSPIRTATVSPTPAFQGIITITPTITRFTSPSATGSPTPATTLTAISTLTATPTHTRRPTLTPTLTATPSRTRTQRPTLTPTRPPTRTFTPTRTPTFTPTPRTTTGGVTVERVSPNLIYLGGSSCGPVEVTILARATAPNGINVVVLFYRFQTASSSTEFQSVSMKSIGGDLYERTLNPTSLLGGAVPFDEATLQYQIVIQQNNGDTSIRTPVLSDITVKACGGVTTSCSSYTDERSCIANGCNWVSIPGIVPVFECRNP